MQPNHASQASFIQVGIRDSSWVQYQPWIKLRVLGLPAWNIIKTALDSEVKDSIYVRGVSSHWVRAFSYCVTYVPTSHIFFQTSHVGFWNSLLSGYRLRSNIHGVWMCSLISLINNRVLLPAIRSWAYWPWAGVTDLLPTEGQIVLWVCAQACRPVLT